MKFKNGTVCLVVGMFLSLVLGCGGSTSTDSQNNTVDNLSYTSSPTTSPSLNPNRDLSPKTISAFDIQSLTDEDKERKITITDLRLKEIGSYNLQLVTNSGNQEVSCNGDFVKYLASRQEVEKRFREGVSKAPRATVSGIYKGKTSYLVLEKCILVDFKN